MRWAPGVSSSTSHGRRLIRLPDKPGLASGATVHKVNGRDAPVFGQPLPTPGSSGGACALGVGLGDVEAALPLHLVNKALESIDGGDIVVLVHVFQNAQS